MGKQYGKVLILLITHHPSLITFLSDSYCYRRLDQWMGLVVFEGEVLEFIFEDRWWLALNGELRQRIGFTGKLLIGLFKVVQVQMAIATSPNEFADAQIALLRKHMGKQCIRRNVEGHSQENVGAALV
jgi:hypothetical protein